MSTFNLVKDPTGPIWMIYIEFIEFFAWLADEFFNFAYGFDGVISSKPLYDIDWIYYHFESIFK